MDIKQYTSIMMKLTAILADKLYKHNLLDDEEWNNLKNQIIELELTELEIEE